MKLQYYYYYHGNLLLPTIAENEKFIKIFDSHFLNLAVLA